MLRYIHFRYREIWAFKREKFVSNLRIIILEYVKHIELF